MPQALVDTSVLFAAAYRWDRAHDAARPILGGVDSGELPEAVVLDYVLAETLNGLNTHAGHDAAVDFLTRLEENVRIQVESLSADAFALAKARFRRFEGLSFVDACIVASMQSQGLEYLYAFDDDFDVVDGVRRLETPTDPHAPD